MLQLILAGFQWAYRSSIRHTLCMYSGFLENVCCTLFHVFSFSHGFESIFEVVEYMELKLLWKRKNDPAPASSFPMSLRLTHSLGKKPQQTYSCGVGRFALFVTFFVEICCSQHYI